MAVKTKASKGKLICNFSAVCGPGTRLVLWVIYHDTRGDK